MQRLKKYNKYTHNSKDSRHRLSSEVFFSFRVLSLHVKNIYISYTVLGSYFLFYVESLK